MVRLAGAKATAGDTFIDKRASAPSGPADATNRPTSHIRNFIVLTVANSFRFDAALVGAIWETVVQTPDHIRTVEIEGFAIRLSPLKPRIPESAGSSGVPVPFSYLAAAIPFTGFARDRAGNPY